MATAPSPDIELITLDGDAYTVEQRLTTFHLASVILDPYTNESSWVLKTAARILAGLRGTDARVNFVLTCTPEEARAFLGPLVDEFMVFCDPQRAFVRSLGLGTLPAFVFLRVDGTVPAAAEGWDPVEWRAVADVIAETTVWSRPTIPMPGDPGPFRGTPALPAS
ncbi:MAG: hypothetical protein ABIQ39_02135 [Ilumatobacteraceae bacterium]